MKKRPPYFLSDTEIDHYGEIFDYIKELHGYLWQVIHIAFPWASGEIKEHLDNAIEALSYEQSQSKGQKK